MSYGICVMTADKNGCAPALAGSAIGGVFLGGPLLLIGLRMNANLRAWKRRHPAVTYLLNTQVSAQGNAVTVSYAGSF